MNEERSFQHHRRPPDVEEALSSMLWTPYERTTNDSSSDEDDQRKRSNRLIKPYSTNDHRTTCDSTYFGDDEQLGPTVAITTTTSENIANTLQSTPFVPFSNLFRNNDDASGSGHYDNHKVWDKSRDDTFRYSYPHYGHITSLNKWWTPSISSKEPPSYESLYAQDSTESLAPETYDTVLKTETMTTFPNRNCGLRKYDHYDENRNQRGSTCSLKGKGIIQPLGHINFAETPVHFAGTELHIELQNRNNNVKVAVVEQNKETKALAAAQLSDEMLPTNDRSQQTENYNDKNKNGNNHNEKDDGGAKENKLRLKQNHQYMQFQCATNSEPIAMARAITTAITGVTDKSTKGTEMPKTISHDREEVTQPVSCFSSNQNHLPFPHLQFRVVNNMNRNNNTNENSLNSIPMNGGCSSNGRRMNAGVMNTLANLFAAAWSDKATTARRAHGSCWESDYIVRHTAAPVVDALAIIQFAKCSLDGLTTARQSRSSIVALSSYSHLWKKTLSGVRTKVKRTRRPSSDNLHVPIATQLDALIPNKCLAELERLYAEFRASESALVAACSDAGEGSCFSQSQRGSGDNGCGSEILNANNDGMTKITDTANDMRLNIPPATNTSPSELQAQQVHTFKVLPTSSVFLTSSDCGTTGRLNRAKKSSGHRYNNLLPEKNNNGGCFNDVEKQQISNEDVVGAIGNDSRSNNALVAVLGSSAIRSQPSLTIHVNSANSDQNNNNNCTNNKNHASYNNIIRHCNDNDCLVADIAPLNVNVGEQQNNIFKSSGVSVVNCNYTSDYTINNSAYKLSATTANTKTIPVNSFSVNKSANEVSPVPNLLCTVEKSTGSNVISVSAAKNGSNGNRNNNVNVADSVNIISSSAAQLQSKPMRAKQMSASTMAMLPQIDGESRPPASFSVLTSEQPRTFTSTECQTDEILPVQSRTNRAPVSPVSHRAQRRRDRRERRQLIQQLSSSYPHPHQLHRPSPLRCPQNRHSMPLDQVHIAALLSQSYAQHSTGCSSTTMPAVMSNMGRPMIPDLLHMHFPPPYSALSLNSCATTLATSPPPSTIVGPSPPPLTTLLTPVISTVPMTGGAPPVVTDGRYTLPLPIIRRSPSERSGKGCCRQWFAGPPLRALIAVVALGGIACALGGAAFGATGLARPPSSHLTAALLMIGVGVVLVTVSGAAWRMTAPGGPPCLGLGSAVDLGRCGRRPCGRGGGNANGLLYPEFQHRPPPPSYQASMQEYRLRLLLLERDRQNGVARGNSPPPTYRSYAGSLLRMPITTTLRVGGGTGSISGTSEYSLPPSYRSRNTTSTTINNQSSVETAQSGHLLPNEDSPEPSNSEQLPYNPSDSILRLLPTLPSGKTDIMSTTIARDLQQFKHPRPIQLRSSAIVEIEATNSRQCQSCNIKKENEADTTKAVSSTSQKELVTIVTISKSDSQADRNQARSGEHIEIVAHL